MWRETGNTCLNGYGAGQASRLCRYVFPGEVEESGKPPGKKFLPLMQLGDESGVDEERDDDGGEDDEGQPEDEAGQGLRSLAAEAKSAAHGAAARLQRTASLPQFHLAQPQLLSRSTLHMQIKGQPYRYPHAPRITVVPPPTLSTNLLCNLNFLQM